MVVKFNTRELADLYEIPLHDIRGKQKIPNDIIKQYKKKVQLLLSVSKLEELKNFRSLNFEYLKGERKGQCSIRLNIQYRLILVPVSEDEIEIVLIKEISKHYE